jgi:hypothetical protein
MVSFLEAPTATERAGPGGLTIVPPGQEEEDPAARTLRESVFMAPAGSKDYTTLVLNAPKREGAGSADRAAAALEQVLAERPPEVRTGLDATPSPYQAQAHAGMHGVATSKAERCACACGDDGHSHAAINQFMRCCHIERS